MIWRYTELCTTRGCTSQILQDRPCREDGRRLPGCPETLMTDGLSSGGGAGAGLLGTGLWWRGPRGHERPCWRGRRNDDPEFRVPGGALTSWTGGADTRPAPCTPAHSRKAHHKPAIRDPSWSSPTSSSLSSSPRTPPSTALVTALVSHLFRPLCLRACSFSAWLAFPSISF